MNVLVTGGAGYLASVLCPALLAAGHKVTALDNLRFGAQQSLALAACCADPSFTFVRGDVRDGAVMRPLLAQADAILPLAALVGAPLVDRFPEEAASTQQAIERIIRHPSEPLSKDQLVIYPMTQSGYGAAAGANQELDEDAPLKPISTYGRIKAETKDVVLQHPRSVVLQLATVYGAAPRMRTDLLVNDFVLRAHRDRALTVFEGHHRRSVVHVRDVASAFLHAIDHNERFGQVNPSGAPERVFNVVGENLTKRELCAVIERAVPGFHWHEAEVGKDIDQRDYAVSSDRLRETGWLPKYNIEKGIQELLKLYRAFPNYMFGNV